MRINRRTTARALRALLARADRMHPATLTVLVLALAGLVYLSAPFVSALLTSLVAVAEAGAYLAGAAMLARLAVRLAATFPSTPAVPPAPAP